MKRWRRTEIRVERREVTVFRAGNAPKAENESSCEVCGRPAAMLGLEDAAVAFGVDLAQVSKWLEEGRVHGRSNAEGQLQICAGSFRQGT